MKVDLLKDRIGRMFLLLFFSALGSTVIQTVYSTVDMICVGHYAGADGSSALACSNPLWAIMFAPGVLTGVGGSIMVANRKGAADERSANGYFTIATVLCCIFSLIITLAMIIFPAELITFFGADDPVVLGYAVDYMRSVAVVSPTFTLCACLSTFMRNDGEAVVPTVATIVGGVINMVLDVLLVFDFGAGLGVAGAGLATSIGQVVAFAIILGYFFTKKCTLRFCLPDRIAGKLLRIITLGFSVFSIEISSAITVTVFNNIIVSELSFDHLAVYGTVSTVTVFFYCLLNAAGTALQPIVSQNFGAKALPRVTKSLKIALLTAVLLGLVCFTLVELFPAEVLMMYMDVNDVILDIGPRIIRIYCIATPVLGITLVASFFFQSILKQWMSVIIALLRGLILPILLVSTLPRLLGVDAIWWCIPITEFVCFLISLLFLAISTRGLKRLASTEPAMPPHPIADNL